jgi:class 3 adenylate cyclase/tetratricopeptide (TPR) repeat protein
VAEATICCSKCGSDNSPGQKFCSECGTALIGKCGKCGADHSHSSKFCGNCGASLIPSKFAAPAAPPASPREVTGERRHLTVLFCDLVGSTAIVAQLDPEEWRETVAGYHRAAAAAVTRFEGRIAKYLGDGVMAYFGWPHAHDNDAERAARAGLAILDAISQLNQQPRHAKLSARIGIDSGAVVIGQGAGAEADVFGDTPNIAARVESAADPDTVAITDATHRLLAGLFVVEDHGAHDFKGVERPIQLYRVLRPSGVRGRFEAASQAGGLTPFVGREDELRSLTSRWEHALEGDGQVALIIGEAGIGKSRLQQRFHEQIAGTPHTWIGGGAGAFFQNTPFYPVVEMLRQFLGDMQVDQQFAQLESRLKLADVNPADAIPLIAPLLNLPLPARYPPSVLAPEQQRRRLLATLVDWVMGAARVQPLVIATEDLHWVDPSTLELIQLLVEQGATARLMLLYTARPEFHPPWPMRAHHTQITLNRLSANNVRTMVTQVAASKALTADTIATVIERTGGIPLFVEELTRAVLERGGESTPREIPATLHDSLMARLDRLGPAKEVLQIGAVIGSEFSYELLNAIHPASETDLQGALRVLIDAELLHIRGIAPDATYQFKHALIRDAAYEALLKSRRKELHRTLARTIDEKFLPLKETHPEVLARHWTEAGEIAAAISAWTNAGRGAEARSAFKEAQESYQRALTQLDSLPASQERDTLELDLRQDVLRMLFITKGYSAPDVIESADRAAALAEKSGNLRQFINLLITRGISSSITGDLPASIALADQALDLAVREGSPSCLGRVRFLHTMARHYRGDFTGAEEHFVAGLQYFDHPSFLRVPGVGVATFVYASWNAWMLGRADLARERMSQAMAVANRNNPHDLAVADFHAAVLQTLVGEYAQAEALAARALELSEKNRFSYQEAFSRCVLGSARAHLGKATEGVALIRRGMVGSFEVGARIAMIYFMTSLAHAQQREGQFDAALETIERTLEFNPHELAWRPEALRLRGELRLSQTLSQADTLQSETLRLQGDLPLSHAETLQAEPDFRESIALAHTMSARSWELRATTSLARLLSSQGRRDEARTMLADIYNCFTEGFDTADLIDAKALLDDLSN